MCQRLERVLDEASLLTRYLRNEQVGSEIYHVRFPFVKRRGPDERPRQAIKALHLDREESTDIIRHADAWTNHVKRLRQYHTAPDEVLFVLQGPSDRGAAHRMAFEQVRRDLDNERIPHVPVDASIDIRAFAGRPD